MPYQHNQIPTWNIFFLSGFFFTGTGDSQDSRGREGVIFFYTLPLPPAQEQSDIYVATLHVRWLSPIFNRTACIYQAATRWDLPPYRITIWLINDVILVFVCLLVDLIQGFCYSYLSIETGGLELASIIIFVFQANRANLYFSGPTSLPWIYTFWGGESFENWLEWLEAAIQKFFWEIDASNLLRNLEK